MLPLNEQSRAITGCITAVLLTASITINVYLLLFTHQRKIQMKPVMSLDEQNVAFLDKSTEQIQKNDPPKVKKKDNLDPPKNTAVEKDAKVNLKQGKNKDKKESKDFQHSYCGDKSMWTKYLVQPDQPTNYKDWTFKSKRPCPNFSVDKYPVIRPKVSLDCQGKRLVMSYTFSPLDVHSVEFGNKCLADVIDNCCVGDKQVPNVVHYISYSDKDLGYFQFVSFMSTLRFIKPCLILIHGMYVPREKHWNCFVSISPNIIHVFWQKPTSVFGHKLAFSEHALELSGQSDVMMREALKLYGGIYLDFDEIVLRPLEPLRKFEYTQGHERDVTMGSQLVMAKKNATFLNLWYQSYKDDYRKGSAWSALWVPANISKTYPELIHVEGYNFTRPNWLHVNQIIFKENYDWSTNYGMHLYVRWYKNETNNDIIRTLNTTLGAVCRHVLFGNKELCR